MRKTLSRKNPNLENWCEGGSRSSAMSAYCNYFEGENICEGRKTRSWRFRTMPRGTRSEPVATFTLAWVGRRARAVVAGCSAPSPLRGWGGAYAQGGRSWAQLTLTLMWVRRCRGGEKGNPHSLAFGPFGARVRAHHAACEGRGEGGTGVRATGRGGGGARGG